MKIPRHLIDQLVAALRLPSGYTGKVTVTINSYKGTAGKVVLAVEEVVPS